MGEISWALFQPQGGNALVAGLEAGQAAGERQRKAVLEDHRIAREDRQAAREEKVGNALANNDMPGALKAAAGDVKLMTTLKQFSNADLEATDKRNAKRGSVALGIKTTVPMTDPDWRAKRGALLAAATPELVRYGFKPDEVAGIDLSDEGLMFHAEGAQKVLDIIGQINKDRDDKRADEKFSYEQKKDEEDRKQRAADAAAGRAVTMRGQDMTDRRAGSDSYRPLTDQEKRDNNLPLEGSYQINGKGKIDRVAGNNAVRPIPGSALAGIQNNTQTVAKIDRAIKALESNPDAIGLKTYAGDTINQRLDPGGVDVRAMIADIGSQKMHDRSGAAVTVTEAPRLTPFIPSVHDRADVAITKLQQLRKEYEGNIDEAKSFYSPEAGYMSLDRAAAPQATARDAAPVPHQRGTTPPRIKNEAEHNSLPSGTIYVDPTGKIRTKS